jgi:adenine-specific DNA-methyltransferase
MRCLGRRIVKTTGQTDNLLASVSDYIIWYSKRRGSIKFRLPLRLKELQGDGGSAYNNARSVGGASRPLTAEEQGGSPLPEGERVFRIDNLTSQSPGTRYDVDFRGAVYFPKGYWKTQESSMERLLKSDRVQPAGKNLYYVRYFDDYRAFPFSDNWDDTSVAGFSADKRYIVETSSR